MKADPGLIPAPRRGLYDRGKSRHERQAAQQERVITAIVTLAAAGHHLTVGSVVEHAGIGRNTFYEYFDDVEHALAAVVARARSELNQRIDEALQPARTPLERVRALARAWSESLSASREPMLIALRAPPGPDNAAGLSPLARCVVTVLESDPTSRSALPGIGDQLRVVAVAAAFDCVSRAHLAGEPASEDLPRTLAELALRLLR